MTEKAKNTVIQIVIAPPSKKGRGVIVSGAPAGEMPIIKTGQFAQMQQLVNLVWRELATRPPQVPDLNAKPAAKAAHKAAAKTSKVKGTPSAAAEAGEAPVEPVADGDGDGDAASAEPSAADDLVETPPTSDQLVANEHTDAPAITPLEQAILDSKQYDMEGVANGTANTTQD